MIRVAIVVAVFPDAGRPAAAHHGGGTFDNSKEFKLTGVFTGLDLDQPALVDLLRGHRTGREGHEVSL